MSDTVDPRGNGRRCVSLCRSTRETTVLLRLDVDGYRSPATREERIRVFSGIGFLDHLLSVLAFHAGWSLELRCRGDLNVDDHHSAEDCALLLGAALCRALAAGPTVERFGWAYAPLDEALARAVVDVSGRPFPRIALGLSGGRLGGLGADNVEHVLSSFAVAAGMTIHVDVERGVNDHHRAEAAFKALALALRRATTPTDGASEGSTKGSVALETLDDSAFERAWEGLDGTTGPGRGPGEDGGGTR
ncbi:MAG TPA: hypothetical protein VMC79_08950 [Rectinemataceae bacterium]|nr:hypothetical protein [Rectinemataceae bacterium]